MKVLENPIRIGFTTLLLLGLFCTQGVAQPMSSIQMPEESVAPDTLSTDQELLLIDVLGTSFQSLAEKSRRDRRVGGYVMLGLGIGSGLGGAATLAFGEGDDARIVGYSLLGGGALLSGLSLLPFKLKGESERIYAEFSQMPAGTPDQIHRKYFYWDRRFEELARKRRRERVIGGVSSIVVGGATGLVVVIGSERREPHAFVWSALGPVLGGVTSLLTKSDAERRYETYRRAKADIVGHTSTAEVRFGVAPLPKGGMLGAVQVRF